MPIKTITCPDCGLIVYVAPDATGSKLNYDFNDWHGRCKRRDLGGPVSCLVPRDGTFPTKKT